MREKTINFKKQREIGDIINDTFKFVKENYKELSKILLKIVGPVFILLIAAIAYYNFTTIGAISNGDFFNMMDSGVGVVNMLIASGFMIVMIIVYYSLLYGTVLHYIKQYNEDKNNIKIEDISAGVKQDFWGLIGLGILTFIMILVGLMLCVIPGIYLMVPLSLVFAIMIFEGKDATESISYSFTLIKDNWWSSFAVIFIIGILLYLISLIFQIPLAIYSFSKAFTASDEINSGDLSSVFDWVYISVNVISTAIQYILYGFYVIVMALIYYNLNERKNFTGTIETIDSLGQRDTTQS